MKEFNLEKYLNNPSQKVVTRDGKEVRIICTDMKNEDDYKIVALVQHEKYGGEEILCYRKSGKDKYCPDFDLFFAPIKKEGWVNVFDNFPKENHDYYCDKIYKTKEDAEKDAKKYNVDNYVTTTKIEWEE